MNEWEWMEGLMNVWTNEWMDGWMCVCMNEWMYVCIYVRMHCFSLKMDPISCLEKSVNNHRHEMCYIPEERRSQIQISCPVNFRTSLAVFETVKQQDSQCAYDVTLRRRLIIIIAVDKQTVLNVVSYVCSLNFPARRARAPCFIAVCGLFACTIFFHIIS